MPPEELLRYAPPADLLAGRTVLVTGAGDGVGRAVALGCARHGATVILLDRDVPALESCYDAIEAAGGPRPAIYPLDLAQAGVDDYRRLADIVGEQFERLDGLVNNAGHIGAFTPFAQCPPELYREVMAVNLHAPFFLTQACLPLLQAAPDPAIVFSTHHLQRAYTAPFGIAKAGLAALLAILADELDTDPAMRVNGLDTGPLNTAMRRAHYPGEPWADRPAPEYVVPAYLYFLGPDSRGQTGHDISLQPA